MSNQFTTNKIRFCHSYQTHPSYPFAIQHVLPANMLGILKKNPKNFHGGESYVVASSGRNSRSDYSTCVFKFPVPLPCISSALSLHPHSYRIESVLPYLEPFVHGSPLACSKISLALMPNHSPLSTIPSTLPL